MSNQPQPLQQAEGESREAFVRRVSLTLDAAQVGRQRYDFNAKFTAIMRVGVFWFFRHWLLLANIYYAMLLAFAYLSPIFFQQGWGNAGLALYNSLNLLCDQVPTHSYYVGGYQLGLCQRCLAIYTAMLLGGLYYAWLRRTGIAIRPLPLMWFILLTLPLVLDGFTQLFGWRHSGIPLRTVTGALFGFASVATIYPWFDGVKQRLFATAGSAPPAPAQPLAAEAA